MFGSIFRWSNGGEVFRRFIFDAARLVVKHGGSCSGEHGDGRARSELLPLMYSPRVIDLFAAVKALVRSGGSAESRGAGAAGRDRRESPSAAGTSTARGRRIQLLLDAGDFTKAVHRCVGVGRCRADTTAAGGFMCPSYLASGDEKDVTRGRARVLQEVANGGLSPISIPSRCASRWICACPARLVPATARPVSTWPSTSPRRCTAATERSCGPSATTASAGCRAGSPLLSKVPRIGPAALNAADRHPRPGKAHPVGRRHGSAAERSETRAVHLPSVVAP